MRPTTTGRADQKGTSNMGIWGVNKDTWPWTTQLDETWPGLHAIWGKLNFVECGRGETGVRVRIQLGFGTPTNTS